MINLVDSNVEIQCYVSMKNGITKVNIQNVAGIKRDTSLGIIAFFSKEGAILAEFREKTDISDRNYIVFWHVVIIKEIPEETNRRSFLEEIEI